MPQMFPLLWLFLFSLIIFSMIIIMSMIHHSSKNICSLSSSPQNSFKTFLMTWSW